MTGFGRAEGVAGGRRWTWELRSVNSRSLDVKARLPQSLEALEPAVREAASKRFTRGAIQAGLSVQRDFEAPPALRIDMALVERLVEPSRALVADGAVQPPRWDGLLAVRGVVTVEDGAEESEESRASFETALRSGLAQALDALAAMRTQEGRTLQGVLETLLDTMAQKTGDARACAAGAPASLLARLEERLASLAGDARFDPARLAQEAALLASRGDVQEELERLDAHIAEARTLIGDGGAAGRRLEFLAQELNREANTLCSKSSDLRLTRLGLDLKTAIDQFREQCANAE